MKISVKRTTFTENSTIGTLSIDGAFECFTLEDKVRPKGEKVPGKTAIPAGTYRVVTDFSNRFQKMLPHLLNVPGFEGVRIHTGNAGKDTEGCILLGRTVGVDFIGESKLAFDAFFKKLNLALRDGEVYLEVA